MMLRYATPHVGSHFFQQSPILAQIASRVSDLDIVLRMRTSTLKRNHMVKMYLVAWLYTLLTNVTPHTVALKDMGITDLSDSSFSHAGAAWSS